jgi:hypothetical protein
MIARLWSARTTRARAAAYADHLRQQVLPTAREVGGYAGAMLLEREDSPGVEILVLTLWQSPDAISGFAGADTERAVVQEEAAALLSQFDERVRHYELVFSDDVKRG